MQSETSQRKPALFGRNAAESAPFAARAEGIRIWDEAGNEYLDASSGAISVISVGHGVEEVVEAMAAQARAFAYVLGGRLRHHPAEDLAQALAALAPGDLNRVIFVSGGSEANETAFKLARNYHVVRGKPEKYIVLSRRRSYHGATLATLSLSGYEERRGPYGPLLFWEPQVAECNCYRCPFGLSYPQCQLRCANDLQRAIDEHGAEKIAAFIAEPIVGAAGAATTPPDGYFQTIRDICDRNDILFIADEIITGLGRTGRNFGIEHWGVVPDVIMTAKGLSGGYVPLGAVIVSDKVADAFDAAGKPFVHGFTYMAHPVTTAAALAVLNVVQREQLIENARVQGERLFARLAVLADSEPLVGEVRGKGLLAGLELVTDPWTKQPHAKSLGVTQRLIAAAQARGLMLYPCQSGEGHGDQVIVSPPLTVTAEEIDAIVERLTLALADVRAELDA